MEKFQSLFNVARQNLTFLIEKVRKIICQKVIGILIISKVTIFGDFSTLLSQPDFQKCHLVDANVDIRPTPPIFFYKNNHNKKFIHQNVNESGRNRVYQH